MRLTPTKAHVIIYSRPGSHLCEEAKQAIDGAQCANEYTLEEIDIESDGALAAALWTRHSSHHDQR